MNQTARVQVIEAGRPTSVSQSEHDKVLEKLRQCEAEKVQIIKDHGTLMKEFNTRMQVHLEEIRLLKEVNHKLQTDMQELRDLCCYLDDDRHKCRKLAREWQRFGRHTATVMRNEATSYQEKLHILELRESQISTENNELKELCLYLDQQRKTTRSATCSNCTKSTDSQPNPLVNGTLDTVTKGPGYSEKLETRLSNIGTERAPIRKSLEDISDRGARKRVSFSMPDELTETDTESIDSRCSTSRINRYGHHNGIKENGQTGILRNGIRPKQGKLPFMSNSKMGPEAVQQAMKVLEIHNSLDNKDKENNSKENEGLDDTEVAVLKEMCNVVWRKLSNGDQTNPAQVNSNDHSDEEVLEDLL